jgi:hypothetical protein
MSTSQSAQYRSTLDLGGMGSPPPLDAYFERARARSAAAAAAVAAGPAMERNDHGSPEVGGVPLDDDVARVAAGVLERVHESKRFLDQGGGQGRSGSSRHTRRRFDLDTVRHFASALLESMTVILAANTLGAGLHTSAMLSLCCHFPSSSVRSCEVWVWDAHAAKHGCSIGVSTCSCGYPSELPANILTHVCVEICVHGHR